MTDPRTIRTTPLSAEELLTPPREQRPGFRWWWHDGTTEQQLVRELLAIRDAGFSEVEIAFTSPFWGEETQRSALRAVLDAAEQHGMRAAMTTGAAWPLQTPNTTRGTPHAAQELQYGMVALPATDAEVALPPALDDPESLRGPRLRHATIARVVEFGDRPTVAPTQGHFAVEDIVHPPSLSTLLDPDSFEVVTERIVDGRLTWTPRDGDWVLLAFWGRDCLQGVASFIDAAAATAATEYLDEHQIGVDNRDVLARVGTDLFEDSLELNADSLFWADDLIERFIERHKYDPTPYLPLLYAHGMCRYWVPNEEPTPDFEAPGGIGARIRQDYYRLITDLYITDHLLLLQRWAEEYGLRHKAQVAYGQNLEPVRSNRELARAGGRPEGESLNAGDRVPVDPAHPTWRFALDWTRAVVGGAHQGGATRISSELGAQFQSAYDVSLGDLRQMLDKAWATGITRPFVHGFASQPDGSQWPGHTRFWDLVADSWNDEHYPEWANWRALTDYWARGTAVLETGIPRTDVAMLRDGFLTTAARGTRSGEVDTGVPERLADTEALESVGFSVQFVEPIGLSEPGTIGENGILYPDGPAYRVLIVTENALPPEAAEAIAEAAERGLPVVFVGDPPTEDSGFAGGADGDARVVVAITRALAAPTSARVAEMFEVVEHLRAIGLRPRAQATGAPVLSQWREAGGNRSVVLYNPSLSAAEVTMSLEGEGVLQVVQLDRGIRLPQPHSTTGERTTTELSLRPLELLVLELDTTRAAQPASVEPPVRYESVSVDGWDLAVIAETPAGPRSLHPGNGNPGDWQARPELAGISGTGRYSARAAFGSSLAGVQRYELHIGGLAGSARIRFGGADLGTVFVSDSVVTVDAAEVRDGNLEIEVRTTLRSAVASAGTRDNVASATRPVGLIGPVRLVAVIEN